MPFWTTMLICGMSGGRDAGAAGADADNDNDVPNHGSSGALWGSEWWLGVLRRWSRI